MARLDVVLVSFEAVPFAKVGGLADVAGALPDALEACGVRCRLVIPRFADIDPEEHGLTRVEIPADWYVGIRHERYPFEVWRGQTRGGAEVYLLGDQHFFGEPGIYADADGNPFPNELDRYVFFAKGAVEMMKCLEWRPDVIHHNDYQTGPIGAWVRRTYPEEPAFEKVKLVYSIHNLAYQGRYGIEAMDAIGFSRDECSPMAPFEFHGGVNLMKLGVTFADEVTTVSPTYAREILGEEEGAGLQGVLHESREKLSGILNGIDTEIWNPAGDRHLETHYDAASLDKKKIAKEKLLEECGLDAALSNRPLLGLVGRLVEQKGIDLLLPLLDDLVAHDVLIVILGSGAREYEDALRSAAERHPGKIHAEIGFNEAMAHRITAGADIFLMPSRYEPCGLNQMYSMRYGTIPVVHRTGGLADTVEEWDGESERGSGFLFDEVSSGALADALGRALAVFDDADAWESLQRDAMARDFSWERSARTYREIYER